MSQYKNPRVIMVAMDGSEDSEYACKWYLDNLHQGNDIVMVIHCPENKRFSYLNLFTCDQKLVSQMIFEEEQRTKLVLAKINEQLKRSEVDGRIIRQHGHPGETIVKTAESHRVDLIVVGTRGLGTQSRAIIGSTTNFVIHHSRIPVLITRQERIEPKAD